MFDSGGTFEDVLSRRLGPMHALALFLACDSEKRAEQMLTRAVARALDAHLRGEEPERALDLAILAEAEPGQHQSPLPLPVPSGVVTVADRNRLRSMSPACIRTAAARIPPDARAAIWLVVVERRSYDEAANLLGVDEAAVSSLLAWRDALIRFALDESAGGHARVAGGAS